MKITSVQSYLFSFGVQKIKNNAENEYFQEVFIVM